jgi:hypothetical protein
LTISPAPTMTIQAGYLVRDSRGRPGIVCTRKDRPSEDWIDEQLDAEDIRRLDQDVPWWGVIPLDGGLVLVPEPMLEVIRPAAYEDFLVAADHANIAGRKYLATLFPHYVDRVLAERRAQGKS